ncbi:MAG: NfeD family protein [Lachnospiraceae bacterium]|nr:NfeD family protein [Lachnospiraceae bacterium]
MNTMVWLAAMIILIVIEIVTVGIGAIWFAIGSLAAVMVSLLGGGTTLQITAFLAVSFATLIFTRPYAVKYINSTRTKTNYEGIIGKVVRVTQDVDNVLETGCAVVNGSDWTVRAADNNCKIAAGSLAKVVDIKGVKLIVERYEEGTDKC